MTQDNKTIKCELTVKQLFFLMKSTKKWKKGFRKHFLNNAGVTKYLNNQLMNNSKVEELEKLKQEWKEDLAIWEKEHHLESKKKVEKKKPEKEVWGDINSF